MLAAASLAAAALMTVGTAGCGAEANQCALGTEACSCTSGGACDPGLLCQAGLCVRGLGPSPRADAAVAMDAPSSTSSTAPPLTDVLRRDAAPTATDARPREGGINIEGDGKGFGAPDAAPGSGPTWTIFVYGHADHNLSPTMLADLGEMSRAKLNDNVRVVTLVDWESSRRIPGASGEKFPAGTWLYRPRGEGKYDILGKTEELDFDDPAVLADAITLAFKNFPADRYGLVLWDHGGSFHGGFGGDSQNDTRDGQPMSVIEVSQAVRKGLDQAGLTGTRPLDFFSFDACLMNGVEVTTAFTDLADVYISNAELDYGPGWDYEGTLSWLAANPAAPVAEFARMESQIWDAHHRDVTLVDRFYRSHAAYDMSKWGDFVAASRVLAGEIRSQNGASVTARSMFWSLPSYFKAVGMQEGIELRDIFDLFDSLGKAPQAPLATAAQNVLAAARAARIAGANGTYRQHQLGMHLLAGQVAGLHPGLVRVYPQLATSWSEATGWGDLLTYLKAAVPAADPTLTGKETVPPEPTDLNPPRIDIETTSPDTAYIEGMLLQQDPKDAATAINYGTFAMGKIGAGKYTIDWLGSFFAIDARPAPVTVTMKPWSFTSQGMDDDLTSFYRVEGSLRLSSGEEEEVALLVDQELVASVYLMENPSGGYEVASLADLTEGGERVMFIPSLEVFDNREGKFGRRRSELGVYLPASGKLDFISAGSPAGNYLAILIVVDVWGKATSAVYPIPLSKPLAPL